MKSIRHRLIGTYVLVILITTLFFNISIIVFLRQYYITNIREVMMNQTQMAGQLMESFFNIKSDTLDLNDFIRRMQSVTTAQIQIIDHNSLLVTDSAGYYSRGDRIYGQDIEKAIHGKVGTWTGKDNISNQALITVAHPVLQPDGSFWIIRAVSTLEGVNQMVFNVSLVLLLITVAIMVACLVVSYMLSSSIINPLRSITRVAEKMAEGNLKIRAVSTSRDEIGRLSDTLNYMAQELSNHERMKDEFIASISHELRTPLTSIKGWAITLLSNHPEISDEYKEGISIIEKESDRLSALVEELLDFSKFAAGKVTLNRKKIQLTELIQYIQHQITPKANRQRVHLNVQYPQILPEIYADEARLKQVFINLLDNAIHYTPAEGRVEITMHVKDDFALVCVRDTGVGMHEEVASRAKQKFFKSKESSGSGLGLAICDEIVRMHGGELAIQSEMKKGTTVCFSLPLFKE